MHKATYKCVTDKYKEVGFEKGQLYFFLYDYGTMINRDLKEYYFWKPEDYGFVEVTGFWNTLKTWYQYYKYWLEDMLTEYN